VPSTAHNCKSCITWVCQLEPGSRCRADIQDCNPLACLQPPVDGGLLLCPAMILCGLNRAGAAAAAGGCRQRGPAHLYRARRGAHAGRPRQPHGKLAVGTSPLCVAIFVVGVGAGRASVRSTILSSSMAVLFSNTCLASTRQCHRGPFRCCFLARC
jgi:hypothetical protein